jgi:hypothetical protein
LLLPHLALVCCVISDGNADTQLYAQLITTADNS